MSLHYLDKQRAVARIGAELQRRGWTIFDYDPGEVDGMRDYYRSASWGGVAVHEDLPGIVVGVDLSAHDVKQRSGKDHVRQVDGVPVVDWAYPTFGPTPKGRAWHIEYHGRQVATGTGFSKCSSYTEAAAARGVAQVVDEIEQAARRAARFTAANDTTDAPVRADAPPPTTATRDGRTVTVTYTTGTQASSSVWSWVEISPRIDRDAYQRFARAFDANWSRKRQAVYLTRQVDAQAILDFLVPPVPAAPAASDAPLHVSVDAPAVAAPAQDEPIEPLRAAPFEHYNPPADETRYAAFIEIYTVKKWGSADTARQAREARAQALRQVQANGAALWQVQTMDTDRGAEVIARRQAYTGPVQFGVAVDPPRMDAPAIETRFVVGMTDVIHDLIGGEDRIVEIVGAFAIVAARPGNAGYLLGRLRTCRATGGANEVYDTIERASAAVRALLAPAPTPAIPAEPSVAPTPPDTSDTLPTTDAPPTPTALPPHQRRKGQADSGSVQLTFSL